MKNSFPSEFFYNNRQNLLQLHDSSSPIVITAHGLLQQKADAAYPFRQDGNFWYLTGIDEPDIVLVLSGGEEFLILPPRSSYLNDFHGAFDKKSFSQTSGIQHIYDNQSGWEKLSKLLKASKHVATLVPPPPFVDVYGFYTNPARSALLEKITQIYKKIEVTDIRLLLGRLRMIKQPCELAAIQSAIDITGAAIQTVRSKMSEYSNEFQIEADLTYSFTMAGADSHAFAPIVASGKNAAILHYDHNNQPLKNNEMVLLDIGAQCNGYAADISRVIMHGRATQRQKDVHAAVRVVQQFAFEYLKPGVMRKDYEQAVEQAIGEQLIRLKVIASHEKEQIRKYYPHSVSHFMGFDVHDAGDYDTPYQAGMVLTVEPGIYLPSENIGVRIEDDVVLTKSGIQIMSKNIDSAL